MEQLHNGFMLDIPKGVFPLSTDSILLADFARLPKNASVLDLGSGCGTLGVLLCAKDGSCTVTGIERNSLAHEAAIQNICLNGLTGRLHSICADFRSIPAGTYHICISNPPYYTGGPASNENADARRDDHCSTEELMQTASRALRWGGDFFLVHKPEKLANLCASGAKFGLEAKRLRLVRHSKDGDICLILLQHRKGAKPGLIIDEVYLHDNDGTLSDYYRTLYHIEP